jgi:hypothetical protein
MPALDQPATGVAHEAEVGFRILQRTCSIEPACFSHEIRMDRTRRRRRCDMDPKTALGVAGALTLTSAAAVSALFLTIGNGGATATDDPAPEVVTEFVVADTAGNITAVPTEATIYEVEYVEGPAPTGASYEDEDSHDEYEDDEDEDDDDGEDDDD